MNESKRNAKNKYRAKVEELRVELYPTDADIKERIAERLAAGEPKASYIKRLIRADMESDKQKLTRLFTKMMYDADDETDKEYQAFRELFLDPMLETIEQNKK